MKEKDKGLFSSVVLSVLFVILTGGAVCACSFFYIGNTMLIIRNTVMAVLGALVVLDAFWVSAEKEMLDYQKENGVSFQRFVIIYFFGLCLAVICPLFPYEGWPYMILFAALALFSNMACGMSAGTILLMISVFLTPGVGTEAFILHFMCGIVVITLFQNVDENFKAGVSIGLSLGALLVCETAIVVLFEEEQLSLQLVVIPIINVVMNAVLLIVLVKVYQRFVLNKYTHSYQRLNDTDFALLAALKEKSPEEYYHAINTARLSEHIAKKLQLNDLPAKTAASYLKLGVLCEENNWENVKSLCKKYKFPPAVMELLRECLDDSRPKQKETVVILFADEVISVLQDIFKKDIDAEVDYAQIVDKIYHQKIVDGMLRENPITYTELQVMRKQFLEEKLYYDILR